MKDLWLTSPALVYLSGGDRQIRKCRLSPNRQLLPANNSYLTYARLPVRKSINNHEISGDVNHSERQAVTLVTSLIQAQGWPLGGQWRSPSHTPAVHTNRLSTKSGWSQGKR